MAGIPHEHYEPKTRLGKWAHERLPLVNLIHDTMVIPTPKNLNWWWIWGGVLTVTLGIMIVTGIILAMHYDVSSGFASVQHIDRDVPGGWAFRDVHMNGASLFFVGVYIHIFRGLYYGSYKAPREITWLIGVIIFFLMMATAFMGYTLPQGQMSLHGTSVITGLFGAIPFVGPEVQAWLLGGPAVNDATYNRFFALHFLLPFVIAAMVAVHIWAFHSTGNNNPTGVEVRRGSLDIAKKDTVPFWPYFVIKDAVGMVIVLAFFGLVVWLMPDYLGHPDNYIIGNRFVTPEHIVPEWYFLAFYAMLRAITFDVLIFDAKFAGVLVMIGSIAILALAPWTDTSRIRSGKYRPLLRRFFWLLVVVFVALIWCGSQTPSTNVIGPSGFMTAIEGDPSFFDLTVPRLSLILTIYWFAYFLVILPILGLVEKTQEVPATIEDDFNAKYGAAE